MSRDSSPSDVSYVGDDDSDYFRSVHGRSLSTLNTTYMLPVDQDEVKRSELHHRMLQFVFRGKNYLGPVKRTLQFGEQRRVLDLGTGAGHWAIDMADEFPSANVIGIDIAPIQPRSVPPNCTFELCDLDQSSILYPNDYFDMVHARSMHTGIRNYPRLLREIARVLRPGGLVLLVEPNPMPIIGADGQTTSLARGEIDSNGWYGLWKIYRECLLRKGIDVAVPQRLSELLSATHAFENVVTHEGHIPVGFWPQDEHQLTVGQLQWSDYDLFIPALRPFFLSTGIPESSVNRVIEEGYRDLYYPSFSYSTLIHVAYAIKQHQGHVTSRRSNAHVRTTN